VYSMSCRETTVLYPRFLQVVERTGDIATLPKKVPQALVNARKSECGAGVCRVTINDCLTSFGTFSNPSSASACLSEPPEHQRPIAHRVGEI